MIKAFILELLLLVLLMQVMSSSPFLSPTFNNGVAGKFSHDFGLKLRLEDEEPEKEEERIISQSEMKDEKEAEEEEFSFVCLNPDGSPISADDLFQDGQIRPVFPLFNRDLLFTDENGTVLKTEEGDVALPPQVRKVFVEDSPDTMSSSSSTSEPAGPYCEWRGGRTAVEAPPDTCRKSNSTGFSKLWRFRDLKLRCSSDGKDAFVFLNQPPPSSSSIKTEKKNEKEEKKSKVKVSEEKLKVKQNGKTASPSAHEQLYVENRAQREGVKRRSYLPYKQVGFFTNVSGLSRNVHPY
ncbi:uncharacterized protein LOC120151417 isoform X2 [Hibiscus syriacus]|uniref:uncharacterized protein LOC120151417 isoform X2 n=1 Tax=Hibiscus syriacus TaxID=106335 RepID=UPI00192105FE|nr:uncharacterized protein LOC120151417 isoform X2 [Hibiscus syriacus]